MRVKEVFVHLFRYYCSLQSAFKHNNPPPDAEIESIQPQKAGNVEISSLLTSEC